MRMESVEDTVGRTARRTQSVAVHPPLLAPQRAPCHILILGAEEARASGRGAQGGAKDVE
jgi:hypothetical protein